MRWPSCMGNLNPSSGMRLYTYIPLFPTNSKLARVDQACGGAEALVQDPVVGSFRLRQRLRVAGLRV